MRFEITIPGVSASQRLYAKVLVYTHTSISPATQDDILPSMAPAECAHESFYVAFRTTVKFSELMRGTLDRGNGRGTLLLHKQSDTPRASNTIFLI